MLGIVIFLTLVVAVFGLAILGWVEWSSKASRSRSPTWRNVLGFVSLVTLSLQILICFVFEAYGFAIGSFSYRSRNFVVWGRIDFYLFIAAVVLASLAKGRLRIAVVLSAVAIEVVWFLLGTGL